MRLLGDRGGGSINYRIAWVLLAVCAVLAADFAAVAVGESHAGRGQPKRLVSALPTPTTHTVQSSTTQSSPPTLATTTLAPTTTGLVPTPPELLFGVTANASAHSQDGLTSSATIYAISPAGTGLHQVAGAPRVALTQVSSATGEIVHSKVLSTTPQGAPQTNCGFAGCGTVSYENVENGIAISRPDGSNERILTRGGYDTQPAFSPDGSLIAFLRHIKTTAGQTTDVVAFMTPAGTIVGGALPPTGQTYTGPAWSPDGRSVAVATSWTDTKSVWVVPVDGSPARQLASINGHFDDLAWSHDGREIAVEGALNWRSPNGPTGSDLWVMPANGGPARQITHFSPPTPPQVGYVCGEEGGVYPQVVEPQWSPDDTTIAFLSSYPHVSQEFPIYDVEVIRPDGTGLRTLWAAPPPTCFRQSPTGQNVITKTGLLGWAPSSQAAELNLR